MILALLLLFGPIVLRDDVSTIPANHRWRYDQFVTTRANLPVDVACTFRVLKGSRVRVELLTEENLRALREGRRYEAIQASSTGSLRQEIGIPGIFAIVVWNDDEEAQAEVALRLALEPSRIPVEHALSPQRKMTVIVLSLVGFVGIAGFSARALLRTINRRPGAEQP